jgi:hypothetical protein
MANTEVIEWVVRLQVTEAQKKALRVLAVERDQEIGEMMTAAISTSPITRKAFA